jgi:hypothetical protein
MVSFISIGNISEKAASRGSSSPTAEQPDAETAKISPMVANCRAMLREPGCERL